MAKRDWKSKIILVFCLIATIYEIAIFFLRKTSEFETLMLAITGNNSRNDK